MKDETKHSCGAPGEVPHEEGDVAGKESPTSPTVLSARDASEVLFTGDYLPAAYYPYDAYGAHHPTCQHYGTEVKVGDHIIYAGGAIDLKPDDLREFDVLVPLLDTLMPFGFGTRYSVLALPLKDFGGVPPNWRQGVTQVIGELEAGQRVLTFCHGGHGRTGTLLASLIALLEDRDTTPDPIEAVRTRYCDRAVETREQAAGVFALRGELLPQHYHKQFPEPVVQYSGKGSRKKKFFKLGRRKHR